MPIALPESAVSERQYRDVRRVSGLALRYCRCCAGVADPAVEEEHSAFSVTLVERGAFTYRTRAGGARLSAGWLMLGNAGDGYACSHEDGDGTGDDCVALSLSEPVLDGVLSALGVSGTRLRFDRACLPPVPRVTALLQTLRGAGEGFALEEAALAAVAAVHGALHATSPTAPLARDDERARAAMLHMDAHGTQDLSLDDLARAADLSPFHLLRVFRQAIGITPHQYLMRVRLQRAITLLRDTQMPIIDIAYASGWADLSNFNRAFRRELHCSPRELRRGDAKLLGRDAVPSLDLSRT
ncbi:MAG TPA: helix-turn-helix transcriptional regulator [Burkholderiaceae bacterium]